MLTDVPFSLTGAPFKIAGAAFILTGAAFLWTGAAFSLAIERLKITGAPLILLVQLFK